ncbi:hypothetical protein QF038_002997 [Pseudarthrobacter sp. W1I19]|nr:hypothetical protein [Pseudarthrobacter sp. W1I19]
MASAIREYTATRRGEPGWAATGWDRNRAASWCTFCLASWVWDFQPTGVTGLLDNRTALARNYGTALAWCR